MKAPLRERTESDVEDAFPTLWLSSSWCEWTTEGAAELSLVGGGIDGASWLDGPVVGESVMRTLLCPEAVLDDMASTRGVRASLVITGAAGPRYHPYQAVRLITCRRQ